jgi:predicted dehydrogenase
MNANPTPPLGICIVGCGLIGQKRAKALPGGKVVACADLIQAKAEGLARNHGAAAFTDWRQAIAHPGVEVVVVATLHDQLPVVARGAIEAGKHVLIEKPAGRHADEVEPLIALAQARGVRVRVGFNHRFHPAFLKADELLSTGTLGPLMFIRARYGHGGRVGYDREWRADPALSGGGELIDQGVHLIDLARKYLGEFPTVAGRATTEFWDMPVDDNAFLHLTTASGRTAWLHASCSEWKNLFSFEIYGRHGKLDISGLGGSYGVERLTWYRMLPEMGPPETQAWEWPRGDDSWTIEFRTFVEDIRLGRDPVPGLPDAVAALRIVSRIYEASR